MKKIILSIVALVAFATPAIANAEAAPKRFEHDGKAYSYTVQNYGDYRVINGMEEKSGKTFRLRVGESRVRGVIGVRPVNFPLRSVQPLVAAANAATGVAAL